MIKFYLYNAALHTTEIIEPPMIFQNVDIVIRGNDVWKYEHHHSTDNGTVHRYFIKCESWKIQPANSGDPDV